MNFVWILEEDDVIEYIKKRNLWNQYKKAKSYILWWEFKKTNLKERQPKWSWMYYFRINKQYRAIWYVKENYLIIIKIDNYQ